MRVYTFSSVPLARPNLERDAARNGYIDSRRSEISSRALLPPPPPPRAPFARHRHHPAFSHTADLTARPINIRRLFSETSAYRIGGRRAPRLLMRLALRSYHVYMYIRAREIPPRERDRFFHNSRARVYFEDKDKFITRRSRALVRSTYLIGDRKSFDSRERGRERDPASRTLPPRVRRTTRSLE